MYHTTGFTRDQLIDICVLITSVDRELDATGWPQCLGLFNSVVAALSYLRHNRTQAEIGESLGVSQPTVSRAITVITPLLSAVLEAYSG
jgi:DNA-binding MarR family transcriptional regulator